MQINEVAYKWAGQLTRRTATRRIILHHAAAVTCTPQQVHQWHLANGWTGIGYHFFVRKDGTVYRGRPEDTVGAHAGNNNYDSLGVCFEGSFDRETMPDVQLRAGQELVAYLKQKYGISTVQRHSDVNATGCPGDNFPFDALAGAQTAKPAVPAPVISGTTLTLPLLTTASRGDTVRCVQAALTGLGYDAGGADGIYGTNTAAAVKRFQASRALPLTAWWAVIPGTSCWVRRKNSVRKEGGVGRPLLLYPEKPPCVRMGAFHYARMFFRSVRPGTLVTTSTWSPGSMVVMPPGMMVRPSRTMAASRTP